MSYQYKFLSFRLEDLPEITKIADKMNKEEKWRLLSVCVIPRTSGNFFSLSAFFEREILESESDKPIDFAAVNHPSQALPGKPEPPATNPLFPVNPGHPNDPHGLFGKDPK